MGERDRRRLRRRREVEQGLVTWNRASGSRSTRADVVRSPMVNLEHGPAGSSASSGRARTGSSFPPRGGDRVACARRKEARGSAALAPPDPTGSARPGSRRRVAQLRPPQLRRGRRAFESSRSAPTCSASTCTRRTRANGDSTTRRRAPAPLPAARRGAIDLHLHKGRSIFGARPWRSLRKRNAHVGREDGSPWFGNMTTSSRPAGRANTSSDRFLALGGEHDQRLLACASSLRQHGRRPEARAGPVKNVTE
jgi:hypothetical protein